MNIFIIKTIKIRSYEMGLYFRDGVDRRVETSQVSALQNRPAGLM